ncbi:MAG: hypothetical protein JWN33_291 [Candidatus Saccharibacteria bacterium]|nr:hypothetical protein [Candidatus Saccharibacteria bacterium]
MSSFRRTVRGFTMIEIIVAVVIIGILATIATFSYNTVQSRTRDNQRQTSAKIIAGALESYYNDNGEYPSCMALSGTPEAVSALLKIDRNVLEAPLDQNNVNSLKCTAIDTNTTTDYYSFTGDGSASCSTGSSCLEWTISYKDESSGDIKTISSRRSISEAALGTPSLSGSAQSGTQINMSWTQVDNVTGYELQRSVNADLSTPTTTTFTGLSNSATGLTQGEKYYFRVRATTSGAPSNWSNIVAVTTPISAPTGTPTVATSLITSNTIARAAVSGSSCPATGTALQYQTRYLEANQASDSTWSSYSGWQTGTVYDKSAFEGWRYTFEVQARCQGSDANSSALTSAQAVIVRPINTPVQPSYAADSTWSAGYRYNMSWNTSCPYGTWLPESVQIYDTGLYEDTRFPSTGTYGTTFTDWWFLGWAAGEVNETVNYYAQYRCMTDFNTSAWSPTITTVISITCEPARRNYTDPRCDDWGQNRATLPWGS